MASGESVYAVLLRDEHMVFPALVSVMHSFQLGFMAQAVGKLRHKFKVAVPATTGDPGFERGFRAQQNCLEFFPIFITALWVAAKFFNPVVASLTALLYLKGRSDYFSGYCASSGGRLAGFYRSVRAIRLLSVYCIIGLAHTALKAYFGVDLPQRVGLTDYLGWPA